MALKFELQVRSSSGSEEGITCPRVRISGSQRGCRARVIGSHPRVAQTSEFVRQPPKPAWVRRQSAPEVRASSQTKLSRGFVGPAHGRERLTALAVDTSQAVSRCVHETGGEESSRCLMRSQNVVPCVGRARAREPHTRVPEEEGAMGGCTRTVPLGKGRQC